jgi:hypothetical protein
MTVRNPMHPCSLVSLRNRTGALSPNSRNGALRQFVSKACSATPELAFLADMFLTSVLQQPEEALVQAREGLTHHLPPTPCQLSGSQSGRARQARQTNASYVTLPFAGTSLANQPRTFRPVVGQR